MRLLIKNLTLLETYDGRSDMLQHRVDDEPRSRRLPHELITR